MANMILNCVGENMDKITLKIENFGLIRKANIDLKNLNVIAGVNGSGKTTSSKLLYCFLVANSQEGGYLANKSIYNRFENIIKNIELKSDYSSVSYLLENLPNLNDPSFNKKISENIIFLKKFLNDDNEYNDEIKLIEEIVNNNSIESRKYFDVSNSLLKSEFDFEQLEFSNTNISLKGRCNDCNFLYSLMNNNDKLGFMIEQGKLNCFNVENIIYIDSLSIFDVKNNNFNLLENSQHHLTYLNKIINSNKNNVDVYDLEFNKKLDDFENKIRELIGGYIYYDKKTNEFIFRKDDKEYSMKNTASGVKQLGIIQILLANRILNKNSFIIINEVEVNLHPDWQIKLAEILVLMIKELNIYVYLNSHSPQFIEALEVYSAKHGLVDKTKFYLSHEFENDLFDFEEIQRKHLAKLYNNLGNPYKIINKVRADNLMEYFKKS